MSQGYKPKALYYYNIAMLAQISQDPDKWKSIGFGGFIFPLSIFNVQTAQGWKKNDGTTLESIIQSADSSKLSGFDMFLGFYSAAGSSHFPDWFDEENWNTTLQNIRELARIAKKYGFRGITFDMEGGRQADWEKIQPGKTFDETAQKARERGNQFAQAIISEYPGATIGFYPADRTINAGYSTTYKKIVRSFSAGILEQKPDKTLFMTERLYTPNCCGPMPEPNLQEANAKASGLSEQIMSAMKTEVDPALLENASVAHGSWPIGIPTRYNDPLRFEPQLISFKCSNKDYIWIYQQGNAWVADCVYNNSTSPTWDQKPCTGAENTIGGITYCCDRAFAQNERPKFVQTLKNFSNS